MTLCQQNPLSIHPQTPEKNENDEPLIEADLDLQQKLTVSEKRAEGIAKALKVSEDAQKTQATNFAKDKQTMQKQLDTSHSKRWRGWEGG